MTYVLLHGAVGSWDEVLAAFIAVAALFGATFAFSRKKSED
jgi:hypothetical protein